MDTMQFFIYLLICAGVTYLIRMIPFVLCRGRLENQFVRSFLFYVPYAVLGAMTFPAIFTSTGSVVSGTAGTGIGSRQGRHAKGSGKLCFNNCGKKRRRQKQKTADLQIYHFQIRTDKRTEYL